MLGRILFFVSLDKDSFYPLTICAGKVSKSREGGVKYNYNNGHIATDPRLASLNFLNALERIPKLIEKYELDNVCLSKDLPVLKEVVDSVFKKDGDLRELKEQLATLDRQIHLSLSSKDELLNIVNPSEIVSPDISARSNESMSIKEIIEANKDKVLIGKINNSQEKVEKDEPYKGIRI